MFTGKPTGHKQLWVGESVSKSDKKIQLTQKKKPKADLYELKQKKITCSNRLRNLGQRTGKTNPFLFC